MRLLAALLTLSLSAASAGAAQITYTFSGKLDGYILPSCPTPCLVKPHTGADFTFVFTADISGIFSPGAGVLRNPVLSASFSITGLADGTFTDSLDVGDGFTFGVVTFSDVALTNTVELENAALIGWDMATAIGPLTDATVLGLPGTVNFNTNLGTLVITDSFDKHFTASLSTPEPATAELLDIILAALLAGRASILHAHQKQSLRRRGRAAPLR